MTMLATACWMPETGCGLPDRRTVPVRGLLGPGKGLVVNGGLQVAFALRRCGWLRASRIRLAFGVTDKIMTGQHPPALDAEQITRLRAMPKTEMHLHLEGAFRWETVRALHPEGERLPRRPPWLLNARPFEDFGAFCKIFQQYLKPATGTAEAVERHTREVMLDLVAQNVCYAEIIIGPGFHMEQGLPLAEVLDAMKRAKEAVEAAHAITTRFMLGLNRHLEVAHVVGQAREALRHAGPEGSGFISGLDLMGDERTSNLAAFVPLYREAGALGLRLRAHAGELCGPEMIRATRDTLGVEHFSHGVRAVEDRALVEELAGRGTLLHLCPTSNIRLGVFPAFANHPMRRLFDAGCRVTLNADDPLIFGTTTAEEYVNAVRLLGFSPAELVEVVRNGIGAAMLDAPGKRSLVGALDRVSI